LKFITTIVFLTVVSLILTFGEIAAFAQQSDPPPKKPTASKELPSEDVTKVDQPKDAVASLRDQIEASSSGPERNRLRLALAEQLVAAGKKAEASLELRTILNGQEFDPQGLYNTGNAFARLNDSESAVNAYRKAIDQKRGNYSRALNNVGVILLRSGRWDEAHDALLSALKLENFRYAEASYNLGRVYAARGESDLAIREWKRAVAVNPDHRAAAEALTTFAGQAVVVKPTASRENGLRNKPGNAAEKLAPASPAVSPANFALDTLSYNFLQRARNFRERGELVSAVENYQRVISREHGYFLPANLELSYALLTLNRTDDALANLEQVVDHEGARYPLACYYLARLYERKGRLASAEELFSKANSADKTGNYAMLLDVSRVRQHLGNFQGALDALEEYVRTTESLGVKPAWSDESLSVLRRKVSADVK
jgi:tetratricopeptide (TPR) repeat protein